MNTSNLEQCYLCPGYLNRSEAGNYKGHFAHPDCIARALAAGTSEPVSGPPGVEGPPGFQTLLPESGGLYHVCETTDPDKLAVIMELPAELIKDGPNAAEIVKECHAVMQLLLTKNRAYGSSFAQPMGVFSKLSPVDAINARMDDKLARMKQAKDYSEDTEADLIGYLILKRIALQMKQESPAPFWGNNQALQGMLDTLNRNAVGPVAPIGGIPGHKGEPGPPCPPDRLPNGEPKPLTATEVEQRNMEFKEEPVSVKLENLIRDIEAQLAEVRDPNRFDCPCGERNSFGTRCPNCRLLFRDREHLLQRIWNAFYDHPTPGGSATPVYESASPLTPDQPGPPPASSPAAPASGPPAVQ